MEICHQGARVAFHARRLGHGHFSTDKKHYPEAARAYAETSVQQVMSLAKSIGPETEALVAVLLNFVTPLRYLRRAQGIVRLGKDHGNAKLELACKKANSLEQRTYPSIERPLKSGRFTQNQIPIKRGENPFLRGKEHFH